MAKKFKPKNKANKTKLASDLVLDHILTKIDQYATERIKIMDDYLVGDNDCRMELAVAEDDLREHVADLEIVEPFPKLLETVKHHDDYNTDDLLNMIVSEEGEIALCDYMQRKGYAIIKIDTISHQSKLQEFVEKELYPLYADLDKFSI